MVKKNTLFSISLFFFLFFSLSPALSSLSPSPPLTHIPLFKGIVVPSWSASILTSSAACVRSCEDLGREEGRKFVKKRRRKDIIYIYIYFFLSSPAHNLCTPQLMFKANRKVSPPEDDPFSASHRK